MREEEPKAESKKEISKPGVSSTSATPSSPSKSSETSRAVILATPAAIRISLEKGIPLGSIKGSGLDGRILESDLTSGTPSSSSSIGSTTPQDRTPSHNDITTSTMQRAIAARLSEIKRTVPHYSLTSEIEMDRVNSLRGLLNKSLIDQSSSAQGEIEAPRKLSVNDFVIKGVALACVDVPEVNAEWHGDFIRQFTSIDISIAVATPTGLCTPVLKNVSKRGLSSISREMKTLKEDARMNESNPDEYQGGGITITNLGMFGSVLNFTSIIKSPQVCIFSVGGIHQKLRLDSGSENGLKEIDVMVVTLTCDHRVVDGALGARWLKAFKSHMENPVLFAL